MADSNNDMNSSALNLNPEEKRAFAFLFNQADSDQLGVVTGERAVSFFERTHVSANVLGEIWQIADTENRGFLSRPGFCIVLRLIGHYQAGREPVPELAFKPAPIPKFDGLVIPGTQVPTSPSQGAFPPGALQPQGTGQGPIRVPPLDPQKAAQYSSLFDRSGAQNGLLDGGAAKSIFEKAGLPNEVLGRIWNLADREQRGALNQTDFIVAMHLLTSMKSRAMTALPNTLPPGFYEAAARRGAPPPVGPRTGGPPAALRQQFTGGSLGGGPRAQSPLARPPGYASPPPIAAQTTGPNWLVTAQEKGKYDQFFATIDPAGRGIITGDQAVRFFSDSGLSEDSLASIWDLADINSEGQLNKDEFAVAMYLIRQQRAPNAAPLPAFLPAALVPPSMRKPSLQQQTQQTTAPAFDNAHNTSNLPKSAAEDLFGLDQPSPPRAQQTPALQPQGTGASISRDPFSSSVPASPTSPQRFQPQPQAPGSMFKPFIPTSAFGASLATQNTGGSTTPSQPQARNIAPQQAQARQQPQAIPDDDLLGDNETNTAESERLTNETTELANMSNQIGNLRNQMEQTQSKKATTQADVNNTSAQKRDLEIRLQQFRAQYEQEVRTVKDLEQQLSVSREATKKMGQELAVLEGTYQDLQTQHQTVAQALQADQAENANLKQRIGQFSAEITRLKPEIEKMKLDARQQKGMVSINKKQLATNESERDRLQNEKADLEREAAERSAAAAAAAAAAAEAPAARDVVSPTGSTMSSTNPFFRKPSDFGGERAISPPTAMSSAPTPSAFDQLFGPSFAQHHSEASTPPATSFGGRSVPSAPLAGAAAVPAVMTDSVSSDGRPTPSATPPLSDQAKESPMVADPPPPPPESRQFSPDHLPVGALRDTNERDGSEIGSTAVNPPASHAGETENLFSDRATTATPMPESLPGAFPAELPQPMTTTQEISGPSTQAASPSVTTAKDFDSAFAGFGESETGKDAIGSDDPFAPSISNQQSQPKERGFDNEFPPIQNLEHEDESESDDESDGGFGDNFAPSSPATQREIAPSTEEPVTGVSGTASKENGLLRPAVTSTDSARSELPAITAQQSPPTYEESNDVSHGGSGQAGSSNSFPREFGGLLPAREDPTSPPPANAFEENRGEKTPQLQQTPPTSMFPSINTPTSTSGTFTSDVFHDASSRPMSSITDAGFASGSGSLPSLLHQTESTTPKASKNAFDDFDDFDDLSEAKEADKSGSDFEFGFGEPSQENSEFNPAFDSPAASTTTMTANAAQTPIARNAPFLPSGSGASERNAFDDFAPATTSASAFGSAAPQSPNSSIQQTPQNADHDWDAIFSGIDNSATGNIDTSFDSISASKDDPWATSTSSAPLANGTTEDNSAKLPAPQEIAKSTGRAITPGTEHDDPILKRLTGMGYPRSDALNALEMYDYDINKAVDHLTSK